MSEKEINDFYKLLVKEKEKASKYTPEEAEIVLKRIGILTKKGNIAKPYDKVWRLKRQD